MTVLLIVVLAVLSWYAGMMMSSAAELQKQEKRAPLNRDERHSYRSYIGGYLFCTMFSVVIIVVLALTV